MASMRFLLPATLALISALPVHAGNLQIYPVSVEVAAPTAATTVNLKNSGSDLVKMQARLFSWSQGKSGDILEKTNAVVVSPPFVELKPGGQAVIRIVRLSKSPLAKEESYRLVVDELPKNVASGGTMVRMVMRYSVPVFFGTGQPDAAKISMGARQQKGKLIVNVYNQGSTHVKLSGMKVTDAGGRVISFGNGLNGYVLGGVTNSFSAGAMTTLKGSAVSISANSNFGPLITAAQLE